MFKFALFLIFCTLSGPLFAITNTKIKICHESNQYPPYVYQEQSNSRGILVDILKRAAFSASIDIEFYAAPWVRCQKDVKAGKSQALFAMIATEERLKQYSFPTSEKFDSWYLWRAEYSVFFPADSAFSFDNYQPDFGLGAPLGYVAWQYLKDKEWLSPFHYRPSEGFKMLAIKKLDGYVVERLIGQQLAKSNELINKVKSTDSALMTSHWYLPFNKHYFENNKQVVETLWQHVAFHRLKFETKVQQK